MSGSRHVATVLVGLLVALATAGPVMAAAKVAPGTTHGGEVVKTGWWWAANEPPAETGILAAPQPTPPNVPAGTLPVAAVGGDPEKVSAIEFALDAEPGSSVTSFDLVLRETDEPGANTNQDTARVVACPVVEGFWADGNAAAWKARPEFDCELASAPGERAATGVWRFDLTAVAALWLSEENTSSTSVVLVEDVDAPDSFQVGFVGMAAKGIGFKAVTVAPAKGGGSGGGSGGTGEAGTGGTGTAGGTGLAGGGGAGTPLTSGGVDSSTGSAVGTGSGISTPPDGDGDLAPAPELAGVATDETAVAAPAAGETAQVSAIPIAAPPWYAGIPKAGLLLLPLTLGLAYLMMLALGPDAQPSTVTARHGVSRALDRLRRAGAQAVARGGN
jgi:hypothetical protein